MPHSRRCLGLPELNVALFAFLLNLPWEFWQAPFFAGMAQTPHGEATWTCTRAALGDAGIALAAFWVVAVGAGTRRWILGPTRRSLLGFVAVGLVVTIGFERLATGILNRWTYADSMPTVPVLGTGLLPLLQWILVPPLVLWLVRRQLT